MYCIKKLSKQNVCLNKSYLASLITIANTYVKFAFFMAELCLGPALSEKER